MKEAEWISAKFYSKIEGISIQATYKRAKDGKVLSKKIGGRLHILNPNFKLEKDGLKDEIDNGNETNENKGFKPVEPILETTVEKSVIAQSMMLRDAYQGNFEDIKSSNKQNFIIILFLCSLFVSVIVYFYQEKINYLEFNHSTLIENIKKEVESSELTYQNMVLSLEKIISSEKDERDKEKDYFRGKIEKIEKDKEDISKISSSYQFELLELKKELDKIKVERDANLEEIKEMRSIIESFSVVDE